MPSREDERDSYFYSNEIINIFQKGYSIANLNLKCYNQLLANMIIHLVRTVYPEAYYNIIHPNKEQYSVVVEVPKYSYFSCCTKKQIRTHYGTSIVFYINRTYPTKQDNEQNKTIELNKLL
jgi:hypothetical protein